MGRLLIGLVRFVGRLLAAIVGATFLVTLGIEVSIRGGFTAVLLPNGANPNSPRDQEVVDAYHLDDNVIVRHVRWVIDAAQGDFGTSIRFRGGEVTDLIVPRLSISGELMLVGVAAVVIFGIPLGLLAAELAGRRSGDLLNVLLGVSQSTPVFVSTLALSWLFAVELNWFPAAGWVRISKSFGTHLRHLALPAVALALSELGSVARIIRGEVLRIRQSEFVAAAIGKGLSSRYVLFRHALRPASLTMLNALGLMIGSLLSGTVIIELIFGIGGLGQLLFESSINRDLPLLLGLTTYMVTVYVTLNSLVDLAMHLLDPRIASERRRRWFVPRLMRART